MMVHEIKTYSIGEVAKMTSLSIPTLRYYDQEHFIPNLKKNVSGIRVFSEENIEAIKVIECLKKSGLSIKDIQQFMKMVKQGDETLPDRLKMFQALQKDVKKQIKELQKTLDLLDFKCKYYQKAVDDGTEKYVKKEMSLFSLDDK